MAIFLQYVINGLIKGSIYVLPAIGVSMIFGMLRIINFAQGEIYMLGAVVAYITVTAFGQYYVTGLLVSTVVMAAFGLLFERTVFRPIAKAGLLNVVIATLSASMVLENCALKFWSHKSQNPAKSLHGLFVYGWLIDLQRAAVVDAWCKHCPCRHHSSLCLPLNVGLGNHGGVSGFRRSQSHGD